MLVKIIKKIAVSVTIAFFVCCACFVLFLAFDFVFATLRVIENARLNAIENTTPRAFSILHTNDFCISDLDYDTANDRLVVASGDLINSSARLWQGSHLNNGKNSLSTLKNSKGAYHVSFDDDGNIEMVLHAGIDSPFRNYGGFIYKKICPISGMVLSEYLFTGEGSFFGNTIEFSTKKYKNKGKPFFITMIEGQYLFYSSELDEPVEILKFVNNQLRLDENVALEYGVNILPKDELVHSGIWDATSDGLFLFFLVYKKDSNGENVRTKIYEYAIKEQKVVSSIDVDTFNDLNNIYSINIYSQNSFLVCSTDGKICMFKKVHGKWNRNNLVKISSEDDGDRQIGKLFCDTDGKYLVFTSFTNKKCYVFNPDNPTHLLELKYKYGCPTTVGFLGKGKIAVGMHNGRVVIWDCL